MSLSLKVKKKRHLCSFKCQTLDWNCFFKGSCFCFSRLLVGHDQVQWIKRQNHESHRVRPDGWLMKHSQTGRSKHAERHRARHDKQTNTFYLQMWMRMSPDLFQALRINNQVKESCGPASPNLRGRHSLLFKTVLWWSWYDFIMKLHKLWRDENKEHTCHAWANHDS